MNKILEGHIWVPGDRGACPKSKGEQGNTRQIKQGTRENWQQAGIREHKKSTFLLGIMREHFYKRTREQTLPYITLLGR